MRIHRGLLLICLISVCVYGCNRAAIRIPKAKLSFPQSPTNFVAASQRPFNVTVSMPEDIRPQFYGKLVAGTPWKGCRTDPFWNDEAPTVVRQRLADELIASRLFNHVSLDPPKPGDLIVRTEIHAFCSEAVGFLYLRVAGIAALRVSIVQDGVLLFVKTLEKVVTDADSEYTGSQVSFIEQAMQVTMADSLRELLRTLLQEVDNAALSVVPNQRIGKGKSGARS